MTKVEAGDHFGVRVVIQVKNDGTGVEVSDEKRFNFE